MENFNTDFQNSSGPQQVEHDLSLRGQTLLSPYQIDSLIKDFNFDESLSFDARQAIASYPFFGQSGSVSYGISFHPNLSRLSAAHFHVRD